MRTSLCEGGDWGGATTKGTYGDRVQTYCRSAYLGYTKVFKNKKCDNIKLVNLIQLYTVPVKFLSQTYLFLFFNMSAHIHNASIATL